MVRNVCFPSERKTGSRISRRQSSTGVLMSVPISILNWAAQYPPNFPPPPPPPPCPPIYNTSKSNRGRKSLISSFLPAPCISLSHCAGKHYSWMDIGLGPTNLAFHNKSSPAVQPWSEVEQNGRIPARRGGRAGYFDRI